MTTTATRLWIVAVLVVTVASPAVAQVATPSEEMALQAYRQGSFSRAVQLYTQALSETDDPAHRARLHISIGWTLFALGREGEVETHLRAAFLEDPDLAIARDYYTQEFLELTEAARAQALSGAVAPQATPPPELEATLAAVNQRLASGEDLEGALADVDRLLEAYPRDPRLLPLKAELLRQLGREGEVADLYAGTYSPAGEQVVTELSIPELILRANRLLDGGDLDTSLELLREAVSRQPGNVAALELMAEAAQRAGRWQEAEFALKSALGLQPDNLGLRLRLGEVYLAKGDPSAARDVFRQLSETYPHSDRAWAALGLLDARLGNEERAVDELATALGENPLLPEVQLAYGELLLKRGEVETALEALRSAANLLHDDPQVNARLGQALLAAGQPGPALERLRGAVASGFTRPDVQRALALALVLEDFHSEADRLLETVAPDPRHDAGVVRALLHLERGEAAEAEQEARRATDVRPTDPALLNLLAAALYRQARYDAAVPLLQRAAELAPGDGTVAANLELARAAQAAVELAGAAHEVAPAPSR